VIVASVVVPQAVAYAQIAGLPPSAGLAAAPVAMLAYALVGTSKTLVVSATTATSALSAAVVGPLAHHDVKRFAALSAALAIVAGVVLAVAGFLRAGAVMDFISKPVTTGFLFGVGLIVAMGQLPKLFGVPAGSGGFFRQLGDLVRSLDDTSWWTFGVAAASIAALVVLGRVAPKLPATLVVLVGSIVVSASVGLSGHGVDVVGKLPTATPDPAIPDVGWGDLVKLLPAAFGVMIVSAEAVSVSRSIASLDGYEVDVNRDLVALGGSNLLAGFSSGFVQSGGASQTMAAERSGGKTQLLSLVAAGLVLLTGLFLAPLFKDLPQATLGAIVIVAIAGFFRVDELRRLARLRRSAVVLALTALVGVLALGVLPGLLFAAVISLVLVMQRLTRPPLAVLARDPASGTWGNAARHEDWAAVPGVLVVAAEGPIFYANATATKSRIMHAVDAEEPQPRLVVLDLSRNDDIDVGSVDTLGDLADALAARGVELRLADVHVPVAELLQRSGLAARVRSERALDTAVSAPPSEVEA